MKQSGGKGKGRGRGRGKSRRGASGPESFEAIRANAAGIDIGSREIFVSVPPGRCDAPVQSFGVMTGDLHRLADFLTACGIDTVAMESTGVYWVPLYEILQEQGFDLWLVNSREVKAVPGRKSDVLDCQWLRRLHTHGLLRRSFRPGPEIVEFRQYQRQRNTLVRGAADNIRRMQKAMNLMNLQLHTVISSLTGKTGMAILRAVVEGERDPKVLAQHRDRRCKASVETFERAMTGNYQPEHLFALKQSLQLYDTYQDMIAECDAVATTLLDSLMSRAGIAPAIPLGGRRTKGKGSTGDYADRLTQLVGVDVTAVPGFAEVSVAALIGEIGTDMNRWPTAGHFAAWLRVVPRADITGGRAKSSRTLPTTSRATEVFRMAAHNAGRTKTAIGAFYRHVAARKGKCVAVVATAHKLARIIYVMIRDQTEYLEVTDDQWDEKRRERQLRKLTKQAAALGLEVVPSAA